MRNREIFCFNWGCMYVFLSPIIYVAYVPSGGMFQYVTDIF